MVQWLDHEDVQGISAFAESVGASSGKLKAQKKRRLALLSFLR